MRIAYVINSAEGGGAALPVPAITGILRDGGADVRVFALTRRDGRALPPMAAAGLDVDVRAGGLRDHLAALCWLDAGIARWGATHIWTSLTRATLLGQLVGVRRSLPVVSWQHAAYLKPGNLALLRATRHLSTLWIGDSHSVTALTAERLGIPPAGLLCWPIFAADANAPQALAWSPGDTIRIGSLGRLHPVKGYHVLIAALARLKAEGFRPPALFEIHIAGEGEQRASLEAAARSSGLDELRLVGFVDQPRNFLARLHLYVQPSLSEGLCIAAHEAMQAGLGVVASAVGELPYSIESGRSGAIVRPGDVVALSEILGQLLRNPERLGAMGVRARERVLARFSAGAFRTQGKAILARLGGGQAPGAPSVQGLSPSP